MTVGEHYPIGDEPLRQPLRRRCGERSRRGVACSLDRGHDGWHMHFGTNGTTGWGNSEPKETSRGG